MYNGFNEYVKNNEMDGTCSARGTPTIFASGGILMGNDRVCDVRRHERISCIMH
jgi:hypothetical protein